VFKIQASFVSDNFAQLYGHVSALGTCKVGEAKLWCLVV
jgi:hypothetical protein